jgi:DNA polymerase-3 subunit gamma/tau
MSYQALARTWRPRTFPELVGQEHVVRALVHALDGERLHHAYLFTGTRGVGKTTVARILAKCLNCEEGVSSKPCGACSACREIDEGRFVDLLEVDAASRTKVDDTRELLENVQYAPTRGRFKVYLIDEVHMLSTHSFNALLKTLEEPPPHVKFLLATTDPHKLPVTVLSRCLQFNLKRLPADLICERLSEVTQAEALETEPGALEQIARSADGSMRDALSLLDQAAAYCEGQLAESDVRAMLGTIDQGHAERLLRALAAGDAPAILDEVASLDERVPDYSSALDELALLAQQAALAQVAGSAVESPSADPAVIEDLAASISPEDLQLFYQIALLGKRDLHLEPTMRVGFEMTLLRMLAFRPAEASSASPGGAAGAGQRAARPRAAGGTAPQASVTAREAGAGPTADASSPGGPVPGPERMDWNDFVAGLSLSGAARQLAANCQFRARTGQLVELTLDETQQHLRTDTLQEKLRAAMAARLGADVRLRIEPGPLSAETIAQQGQREALERRDAAVRSIQADPNVRAMQQAFDAIVEEDTIKPVNH